MASLIGLLGLGIARDYNKFETGKHIDRPLLDPWWILSDSSYPIVVLLFDWCSNSPRIVHVDGLCIIYYLLDWLIVINKWLID